jgi:hypothetical protein
MGVAVMGQLDLFETTAPTPYDHNPLPPQPLPEEGEARKRAGMSRAAASKESQLGYARELAMDLARANDGICDADMVAEALEREGRPGLGNAAGSLFLTHVWEFTGLRVKSKRAHAHANELKVWRLIHG